MTLVRLTLLTACCACAFLSFSQSDIGYVRVRLNNLTTSDQEVLLDQFMRSKPGVLMARTDRNTDVFFAHFTIASGLTEADFIGWIEAVGFEARCSVSGIRNGETLKDLPRECGGSLPLEQNEHTK